MNGHTSDAATDVHGDDPTEASRESVLRHFSGRLESLRLAAGRPSYAKLQAIVEHLRPSTVSTVLCGKTNPTLDFVLHFVKACATFARRAGHPVNEELVDDDAWRNSWLQVQRQLGAIRRSTSGSRADTSTAATYGDESPRHQPESSPAECVILEFSWAYHKLGLDSRAFFRVLSLHLAPEFNLPTAADLLGLSHDATSRHLEVLIAAGLAEQIDNDRYRIRDLLGCLPMDLPTQRGGTQPQHCRHCTARW